MSRRTRNPNTQTAADRKLWRRIKAQLAAQLNEKKKRYGLRSIREARLYCAPPTTAARTVASTRAARQAVFTILAPPPDQRTKERS